MKQEIKERWIAALRSGEYRQTKSRLRRSPVTTLEGGQEVEISPAGYCCLGVLCEVFRQEDPDRLVWSNSNFKSLELIDGKSIPSTGLSEVLPSAVAEWAGLDDVDPSVEVKVSNGERFISLASLNDSGEPFTYIADKIEADL